MFSWRRRGRAVYAFGTDFRESMPFPISACNLHREPTALKKILCVPLRACPLRLR